jgi:hypothetical protein
MYVGVIHRITDRVAWDKGLADFNPADLPAGMSNPITYVGANYDYAFCLWDVPSIEALQPTLDGLTAGSATNTYFAVDPKAFGTQGIPGQEINLTSEVGAKA